MAEATKTPAPAAGTHEPHAPGEWRPFTSLRRAVDRLVEDFDRDFWRPGVRRPLSDLDLGALASPAADVVETDNGYTITVELPGMSEKDIDVKVTGKVVTISGEKKEDREEKHKDYYVSERRYGSFRRTFHIPEGVAADEIGASFSKGVLTVLLPRSAGARQVEKKIPIRTG